MQAGGCDDRVGLGEWRERGGGRGRGLRQAERWRCSGGRLGQRGIGNQVELKGMKQKRGRIGLMR